jgi:23S rRNA (uridine2552-2'-O)-methyltransferase
MRLSLERKALVARQNEFRHVRRLTYPAMPIAKKKHRSNLDWIRRHVTDPYVKAAIQHGYRSRAAYKLAEIDVKDRLLRPGMTVIDLGAAPGSWTQVVREKLAGKGGVSRGRIIALDILPMEPLADVQFIQGDFREEEVSAQLAAVLGGEKVDLVLSDMAPNLSGIAAADAARSLHLAELALEFAQMHLKPNGVLLVKVFQGSGYSQFVEQLKRAFAAVAVRKPPASRTESAETFLLARGIKVRANPEATKG